MNKNNNNSKTGGVGFTGLLLLSFIILKLVGIIEWSWVWVLSPLWISILIVIVLTIIIYLAKSFINRGIK